MSFDTPLIECVPNFSVGFDGPILQAIKKSITSVRGVTLLHQDIGPSANRTVLTFVGIPKAVEEAAFQAVKCAIQHIDMSKHTGAHPRLGAVDVLPIVPVHGVTIEQAVETARRLGQRIGTELKIPGYYYDAAATSPNRIKLEACRSGEYEGLALKLQHPNWTPDFGPKTFNAEVKKTGAVLIGARKFLIAWNVNLATRDVSIAKKIARLIRTSGSTSPSTNSHTLHNSGIFQEVKAIGWYLENFDLIQISMNLTDFEITGIFEVFECIKKLALDNGTKVTGSELVGLIPEQVLVQCGKSAHAAGKISEPTLELTAAYLGLSQLAPFNLDDRILERAFIHQS